MEEEQGGEFGRPGGDVGDGGIWGDGEVVVRDWVRLGGCGRHFEFVAVPCELRVS